ncbi:2-deoxy-scyllo-inosose synthase [Mycobacterium haemophilum]
MMSPGYAALSDMVRHSFCAGTTTFDYYRGSNCGEQIIDALLALEADRYLFVTDTTVATIHANFLDRLLMRCPGSVIAHDPGESMKTLATLSADLEYALASRMTRSSVVISFGGGVPGNLAGVIASLLFRGIRLVHIPTTTVAAMDSVLSQKQAINGKSGKNQIGTYHAPTAVFTDIELLRTLPNRDLISGMCEMAKNALAIDPNRFSEMLDLLEKDNLASPDALFWLVDASVSAKSRVMAADGKEQGRALVLEYGHTVGHAVELWSSNNEKYVDSISHGAAIAYGMLVAARISYNGGWMDCEDLRRHCELVTALGIPQHLPSSMSVDDVLAYLSKDNKRGYLRLADDESAFVLLRRLGEPMVTADHPLVPVKMQEVARALEEQESAASSYMGIERPVVRR